MPAKTAARLPGRFVRLLRSPRFEVAMGAVIFLIGLAEVVEEVLALTLPVPDTHHGLLILGAVIGLRGLVDVIEGVEHFAEGRAESGSRRPAPGSAEQ